MEISSTSWRHVPQLRTTTKDMIEQAKEELQILEAQQPNGLNFLKQELKSFISHLESQNLPFPSDHDSNFFNVGVSCVISTASSVSTQESSIGKKRKKGESQDGRVMEVKNMEGPKQKFQKIDVAVERAHKCLKKIQQLKNYFS